MRFHILLLLTLSTFLGCKTDSKDTDGYAYFGGEIINPNNNYVILHNASEKPDTLFLDKENRFLHKMVNFQPGLYTFTHGAESQWIFLESKDSIMLRLNTIDFDESLVFTGDGARKNNYLVKTFLENEQGKNNIMRLWELEPKHFERLIDSIRTSKLIDLNDFLQQKNYSQLFQTIAKANINYNYYENKEMYPFGYYGYNNLIHYKDLPEHFYDFRKDVDYGDEKLTGLVPYNRFLFSHFNNLALNKYYASATHNVVFDNTSVLYNLEKLHLVDSLITNEKIKNYLLKYTTRDFISTSGDSSEIQEVLNSFLEKSTSNKDKEFINSLAQYIHNLKPGKLLPNIELVNFDGTEVDMDSVITKPTLIYFWTSSAPMILRNSHYKAKILKAKYPELDIVAININDDNKSHWKSTLDQYKFPTVNEYQFKYPSEGLKLLAVNSVKKSILVDKDMTIVNPNALLFSSELEIQIAHLIEKSKLKH